MIRRRTLLQTGVIDISNATVTPSSSYTYDGTAKTPSVTVTLLGETVPSECYDITYSNNVNAGTATVTVTGKDGYEGTATGTFTISKKSLSVTASDQTVTYPSTISSSTSKVSVSGLVSGDSLTSISLSSSISAPGTGTITPSNAQTSKGISNYSVTYYTGTVTINKGTGTVSFGTSTCYLDYTSSSSGTFYVDASSNCGWVRTTDKSVSGYNVYKSVSNYYTSNSYSVMKLTFHVPASMSFTFKVGPDTESLCDYTYITQVDAADVTSNAEPSNPLYSGASTTAEWTDVTIQTHAPSCTIQIVYRKDGSINNSQDCGYVAIPNNIDINFTSIQKNQPSYSGSGSFTWSSSNTSVATINSSTGAVTVVGEGSTTITASMAADSYYTSASSSYTLNIGSFMRIGSSIDYSYTGSYQTQKLSPGEYTFQVWGAQGGSNASYSTYSISSKSGGKGGYSVGYITLPVTTTVQVYVGGQGTSSSGGYNGGGSSTGTSSYNSGDTFGYSRMGGGGGATDIRLKDGSLYSRMIVAGGGSGGAMCYSSSETTSTTWTTIASGSSSNYYHTSSGNDSRQEVYPSDMSVGDTIRVKVSVSNTSLLDTIKLRFKSSSGSSGTISTKILSNNSYSSYTVPSGTVFLLFTASATANTPTNPCPFTYTVQKQITSTSTSTSNDYSNGFYGGGTSGGGIFPGIQNSAGSGGSFGNGADMTATNYRFCSGAGGGGWYGGGSARSDSTTSYVGYSGGGSGWVNISANSSYRPNDYLGLELDSGTTYAGNTQFVAPGGGSETGHSGNGYARITRTG